MYECADASKYAHKTISSKITVFYPFHPLHGRQLEVVSQPRHGNGSFTVIDPSGSSLKVPAWMVCPSAAQHHLSPRALIGADNLLALAQLLEPVITPIRSNPPESGTQPAKVKPQPQPQRRRK
jgi:hypothetical protein